MKSQEKKMVCLSYIPKFLQIFYRIYKDPYPEGHLITDPDPQHCLKGTQKNYFGGFIIHKSV